MLGSFNNFVMLNVQNFSCFEYYYDGYFLSVCFAYAMHMPTHMTELIPDLNADWWCAYALHMLTLNIYGID